MKNPIIKTLSAWLLPHTCILCNHGAQSLQDLCQACRQLLPELMHACERCAYPLSEGALCGQCLSVPPPFSIVHALYLYLPPITKLILELKFGGVLVNARILGEQMAEKIIHSWYRQKPLPDCIIPMPLHAQRLKERGFNQALELARPIAQRTQRPLNYWSVVRVKATAPQAQLSLAMRSQNIHGAFTVQGDWVARHVAIVDDVMTTGYTMRELCRILMQHGVKMIDVWCVARPDKIW